MQVVFELLRLDAMSCGGVGKFLFGGLIQISFSLQTRNDDAKSKK